MTPPGGQIYYIHTPAQTILNAFNIVTHPLCHTFNVIVHLCPAELWGGQTTCALTEPAHLGGLSSELPIDGKPELKP